MQDPEMMTTATITLTIDGNVITVPKGTTVYNAARQMGIDIPIFCYQDRMPPFGACRMCLVEVEKMPKLQASCTLEASEGMVVKTQSSPAVEGRKEIVELLLINHPLDCPICDRGGECPLQEQALSHGPGESRFFEEKRHFTKPWPLGPVLMLDRERCIVCARCTRFGDILAGDHALEFLERGYKTEVGTPDGGPADSKFIGNTIMICPVGALTSQVYRFRARPWDNHATETTCTLCPVGCSMILDSRDGEIMRTRSRENPEVNDIWLCDKGWFGYEFTSHADRLSAPLLRRNGRFETATWDEALEFVAAQIQKAKPRGRLAGWGGNPLTAEECYLFQNLMRVGAGVNHLDHRIGTPLFSLDREGFAPGMQMSIGDCEKLSVVILAGLDLTEEFPVIWLRLRQALNRGARVVFLGHYAPEIATHLTKTILHAPGQELKVLIEQQPWLQSLLEHGGSAALFFGRQYLGLESRADVLTQWRTAFPDIPINIMEGRGNSMGARLAGMHPELGPFGEKLEQPGHDALQVLHEAATKGWDLLYVAGANPAVLYPHKLWEALRTKLGCLIVQDLFLTETAEQADVVLPTLSYVEKGGSFVNIEGFVQKLLPGKELPENLYADGEIFTLISQRLNVPLNIDFGFSEKLGERPKPFPISTSSSTDNKGYHSDTLYTTFAPSLFDHGVRMRHNPHVVQLAKEPHVCLHPTEAVKRGLQAGDVTTVTLGTNSIVATLAVDKGVSEGTIRLPLGFEQIPVCELCDNPLNGLPVEIMKKS